MDERREIVNATAVAIVAVLVGAALLRADETWEPSDSQSHLAALNDTYRAARGLSPHRLDADLCRLCQRHAEWMASRNSMFHGSGENIVAYGSSTAPEAMDLWRSSPPHNGFLLGSSIRSGWGHAVSATGQHFWAGAFRGSEVISPTTTTVSSPRRVFRWFRR